MDEGASVRYTIASAETNEQRNSGAQGNRFGQRLTYEEHCIYLHNTPAWLAPYTGGVYGIFGARVSGLGGGPDLLLLVLLVLCCAGPPQGRRNQGDEEEKEEEAGERRRR